MVHRKPLKSGGQLGQVRRNVGRWSQQVVFGPRRLHFGYKNIYRSAKNFHVPRFPYGGGHVCQPRKYTIEKICEQVAPFSSNWLQCIGGGPPGPQVCSAPMGQPPLDHHSCMAGETEEASSSSMWHGGPQMGWDCVVAPLSSLAYEGDPNHRNMPQGGAVPQLSGRSSPFYQMAPTLSDIIRTMLQRKQVSHENINFYLKKLKNLDRYGQAFKKLWILWAESQPKNFLAPSAHLGASPPPPLAGLECARGSQLGGKNGRNKCQ